MMIHRLWDNSPYCFYVHDQAMALRAQGHDVVVVSSVGIAPFMRKLRPAAYKVASATPTQAVVDGVPVYYPRYATLGERAARLLGGRLLALGAMRTIKRLHSEKPFDVLHAHMLTIDGHAGEIIAKRLGIPVAITMHGTDVLHYFIEGQTPSARNIKIAREADALMAVSSMLAGKVKPYRDKDIFVVPNGVDLSLMPVGTMRVPRSILSVGTLKKRKCMLETLEAFIALSGDYPDATLSIVGIGELEGQLRARIDESKLQGRVKLLGGVTHGEVMRLMASSDVFALPSYGEGYGIVYIEAMAAGAVAIGSEGEGIEDLICDGDNGFLIPAGDSAALERVLRQVFDSPDGYAILREKAKGQACALTWANNAKRVREIYRSIIKK